eukprot:TRINITY_DN1848_c0_g1_i9.p1 TRINITY_DN1848_c0_g1~~TRINITY_DN1848_c0_g1_i9.p1  ORF type:complete len:216 (+),score=26.28 TRINITY_DN1848_c0_g1_i9:58-705(+)
MTWMLTSTKRILDRGDILCNPKETKSIANKLYYMKNKTAVSNAVRQNYLKNKEKRSCFFRQYSSLNRKKIVDSYWIHVRKRRKEIFEQLEGENHVEVRKALSLITNQKFEQALGIRRKEDWCNISVVQLLRLPEGKIFRYIKLHEFLQIVYPNLGFSEKKKFPWKNIETLRDYLRSLSTHFMIQSPHDWYRVSNKMVSSHCFDNLGRNGNWSEDK